MGAPYALGPQPVHARCMTLVQGAESGQRGLFASPATPPISPPMTLPSQQMPETLDRSARCSSATIPSKGSRSLGGSVPLIADKLVGAALDGRSSQSRPCRGRACDRQLRRRPPHHGRGPSAPCSRHGGGGEPSAGRLSRRAPSPSSTLLPGGWGCSFLLVCVLGALVGYFTRHSFGAGCRGARSAHGRQLRDCIEQVRRREQVESQLRQSQKMEAIGQLTGGIAHDFNNMLGVIIGSLDLMQRRIRKGDFRIERFMDAAIKATERAAILTQRLLAFARQQPLAPEPLDANKLVGGMSDLLRRPSASRSPSRPCRRPGSGRTHADPQQLESAILNLAVNARDAMPDGGKLTIETANAFLDDAYAAQNAEVAARAICDDLRHRHRQRHGARRRCAGLRAVLHHQGGRPGNRARLEPSLRLRQAVGRAYQNLFGARDGTYGQDLSPATDRRRKETGARTAGGAEGRCRRGRPGGRG